MNVSKLEVIPLPQNSTVIPSAETGPTFDSSQILVMSISMFLMTFLIGFLPTKLSGSPSFMNLISLFGAGLLVGAALIVIVPEGMSVLYQSLSSHADTEVINRYVGSSLIFGFIVMLLVDQGFQVIQEAHQATSSKEEKILI